jgi:hypothetical protein
MVRVSRLAVGLLFWSLATPAPADIELIGQGAIPGESKDLSGLTDVLGDGTPHDRLGSMGSGIAYSGKGDVYFLVADRGPSDGAVPYRCRFQTMKIALNGKRLEATLQATTLLTDEKGRHFLGHSAALGQGNAESLRLDPEGVRVSPLGTIYISDEYGPFIYEFDFAGKRLASLPVPRRFQVPHPQADPVLELANNKSGRVPNRGMEGLAITPDGKKLVGIMQSPLIQDGGRKGTNVRVLEIELATRKTREFLYVLDGTHTGVGEILAVSDHEFLVLERDGSNNKKRPCKKIFKIDLAGASDITGLETLPLSGVPLGVNAVTKALFLDLLDPHFGLASTETPGKVEGLAFGPDLPDGRLMLLVTTDNDFHANVPTRLYAFAIDRRALAGYVPQQFGR